MIRQSSASGRHLFNPCFPTLHCAKTKVIRWGALQTSATWVAKAGVEGSSCEYFFFKIEIFARGPPSLYKATSPSVDDQSLKKAPPVTARPVVPMLVRVAVLPCDGRSQSVPVPLWSFTVFIPPHIRTLVSGFDVWRKCCFDRWSTGETPIDCAAQLCWSTVSP